MTPQEFISALSPAAVESAKHTGVPASFVIADGALESGWGASMLAEKGMNLFGVKADPSWVGETLTMNTREFLKGHWVIVPAVWRKYTNWLSCISDHADFLIDNPRYAKAFQYSNNSESFAQAVANAGYATDPDYYKKIIEVMLAHNLKSFDVTANVAA